MSVHPVILAGGSGTRLWPLSREYHPKQLMPLMGELTMLQETQRRLEGLDGVADPVIVCNDAHRFLVMDQMRQIAVRPADVIIEPVGRNTAPALTLASLRLIETGPNVGHDPVMLVMPADHVIRGVAAFRSAARTGLSLAEDGLMVTFGVVPSGPETGYGYIRMGEPIELHSKGSTGGERAPSPHSGSDPTAHRLDAFVEKPDADTARAYLEQGRYLWNSGIFMMRASVWLAELKRHRPDIDRACRAALANGHIDGDFYRPGAAEFIDCPSDSIDYAVMERSATSSGDAASSHSAAVVPLAAGWSDIGAWSALWKERRHDENGNVVQGDVYAHSTENALLIAQHRLLATLGIQDVVVVETADAVLVASKDSVQEVKEIVELLKADGRPESESHRKVSRPWGSYEVIDGGKGFQVKRLTINPGAALSLQMHRHRAEHWVVVSGTARVTRGDEVVLLRENESGYVPVGMTHRLENAGDAPLEIIEVQSGTYLEEDDIVRFQDNYNRHKGQ